MKYFSLFSGIGGFELGFPKHWECVGYSETDKCAIKIYQKHFPLYKNYGDARTINPSELPDFTLLCGGFPCQAFSMAGKRRGFEDIRGTLFFEIARIAKAKQPSYLLLENVKGLLSNGGGNTFATIVETLSDLGYDLQWECLNSKNFGVPQNRERVFIIGHLRTLSRPKIFPIEESNNRCIETPEETPRKRTRIQCKDSLPNIRTGGGNQKGLVCVDTRTGSTARGQDFIACGINQRDYQGGENLIRIGLVGEKDNIGQRIYNTKGIACSLKSQGGGQGAKTGLYMLETLVKEDIAIRRLTPLECERLQGFPGNWTKGISDTQRYKCLGNTVTVNVIKAIADKLDKETCLI